LLEPTEKEITSSRVLMFAEGWNFMLEPTMKNESFSPHVEGFFAAFRLLLQNIL